MGLCKTCGTICPFDDERTECDAYAPMTNENWFISIPTEEKAKFMAKQCADSVADFKVGDMSKWKSENWTKWLKEKHDGNVL